MYRNGLAAGFRRERARGGAARSSYWTGTAAAAFFRTEPAVTLTVLEAAMSIDSPVCGFRPVRAERCERSTVSRPGRATLSPRVMASTSSSRRPSITESTVAAETSARLAIAETSSALFMGVLSLCVSGPAPRGAAAVRRSARSDRARTEVQVDLQYLHR